MGEQDDFAAFMRGGSDPGLRRLNVGDRVECRVVQIGGDSVFVEVGTRADGRIPSVQLIKADGSSRVQVGGLLEATVVDPDAPGGPLLAVAFSGADIDTSALEIARESGTPVQGKVTAAIKGGLEVDLGGVRAFCPASQAAGSYLADLTTLVGETVMVIVVEVSDAGRSIVVSRRKALAAERAQAADDASRRLQPGQIIDGTVSSIQKFGAFVDVGGIEGLVHISELSTTHVTEVGDVVRVGESVKVQVLSVDPPKEKQRGPRIRLSMKALQQTEPGEQLQAGEVLTGTVVRMLPHGLVVNTKKGEGMVHIRELGLAPGADHRRAFQVGSELEVTPTSTAIGQLRFSATQVAEVRARQDFDAYRARQQPESEPAMGSFGALLGKMDRSALPPGPKPEPKPKPVPKPKPEARAQAPKPAPIAVVQPAQPAQPAATTASAAPEQSAPPADDPPRPKRRRIVSGRK